MKRYISASNIEYFYWIFPDKLKESVALYKGRTSSLTECRQMLDYYKKHYSSSCVITIKELDTDRWICTRADNF